MDDYLVDLLHKEYKIGKIKLTFLHILLFVGITFVTLMMRYCLRDNETWDYIMCLEDWMNTMQKIGGLKGLSSNCYDYTPPYVAVIYLLSYLPFPLLYIIKAFSVMFDIIMSIMSGVIIYDITKSRTKAVGIYAIMMLVPTVANNSAMWSQCDVIYTTALLCTIYFVMNDKPAKGMIFYGIAFTLKLQSLFVFPALIVLWALKKIDLKHFLFIPLMYFIGILPAWVAGRPLKELLSIYVIQAGQSPYLSMGYPNIYQILGISDFVDVYSSAGLWLTIGLLMVVMFYIARSRVRVSKEFVIQLVLMFLLIAICFLPFLHERYAYVADVVALIYSFVRIKKFYIAILQILTSFSAYSFVLGGYLSVPIVVYSFVTIFLVFDVGMSVYQYVSKNKIEIIS